MPPDQRPWDTTTGIGFPPYADVSPAVVHIHDTGQVCAIAVLVTDSILWYNLADGIIAP